MKLLPFDYAVRNAGRTPIKALLTIFGTAIIVVMVFILGMFTTAVDSTVKRSGDSRNMILLGAGSENYLEQSEVNPGVAAEISAGVDGIAKLPYSNEELISPEIHHSTLLTVGTDSTEKSVPIRGITDSAYYVHDNIYLTEGKLPASGEILIGKLVPAKLGIPVEQLKIGSSIRLENQDKKISGFFEAPGTVIKSEIWMPLQDLSLATQRDSLSCIIVRMPHPDAQTDLDIFTKTRLDLELSAINEAEYYSSLASLYRPIQIMSMVMAVMIITVGVFGGANTITATIGTRSKEMACLETIGYSRRAIIVSIMQEMLMYIAVGYIIAVVFAFVRLNGQSLRFSMNAFRLDVTPPILLTGLAAATTVWLFGSLIPATVLFRTRLSDSLRV